MAYIQTHAETAAIGLIERHTLVRSLSPELMLVDPELAARARELLREPPEANGKGNQMSVLGTDELTGGMSLGLEPPLSPPVVRSPMASAMPTGDGLAGLPTPPPAIRPPESAPPALAPTPQAEVPRQSDPTPAPAPAPEPGRAPELPTMAPPEPRAVPGEPVLEPTPAVELRAIPPVAPETPAAPAHESADELPAMAPLEEEASFEPEPAAFFAPDPVEIETLAPEPELAPAQEPVELTATEPFAVTEQTRSPEFEQLFAPKRGGFSVIVRLKDAEGVEIGAFRDFGTAMEGAQEVIEQFSNAVEGQWPFYAGRFIRPDLIVSVDVVEGTLA